MTALSPARALAYVYAIDRARGAAFYRDILGLELVDADGYGELFAVGDARLRLTAVPDHVPSAHPAFGWEVPDIAAAMDALAAKGIEFVIYPGFGQDEDGLWTSPDGGTRLAWFVDSEGNTLMLSQG